jgi:hypothetical protein
MVEELVDAGGVDEGKVEDDPADTTAEELESAGVDDAGTEDEAEEAMVEELADASGVDEAAIFVHPAGTSTMRLAIAGLWVKKLGYSTLRFFVAGPIRLRFWTRLKTFSTSGLYSTSLAGKVPETMYCLIAASKAFEGLAVVQCCLLLVQVVIAGSINTYTDTTCG